MRKTGIALVTLLAAATAACGESPTAGADASMNPGLGMSGNYEGVNPGFLGSGHYEEEGPGLAGSGHAAESGEEEASTTVDADRNPGLGMTGH